MSRLLYVLLGVVAMAAAVLSFSALRDLAAVCGFSPYLAWLLPVVIDAGAAAGSLVWLGGRVADQARRFARGLALVLLGSSVAANALGHGLAAYSVRPHWLVVVVVSAVAPAVLGAVVHLAVLASRYPSEGATPATDATTQVSDPAVENAVALPAATDAESEIYPDLALVDDRGVSRFWEDAPPADVRNSAHLTPHDRAEELIAEGAGRRRLASELGITEHAARELLAERRNGQAVAR